MLNAGVLNSRSRILALAILGILVIVVAALLFLPYRLAWNHYAVPLDTLRNQLQRTRSVIDSRGALEDAVTEFERQAGGQIFLNSSVTSLAASEVQTIVQNVLETNRGNLHSVQVGTPSREGSYQRVILKVKFAASVEALARILHRLETMQPFLLLENLHIQQSGLGERLGAQQGGVAHVEVEMDVVGYAPGEEDQP